MRLGGSLALGLVRLEEAPMGPQNYGDWHGQAQGWGASILFGILCALIVAGIVVIVIWFLRRDSQAATSATASASPRPDPAMDILRRRLATGEIDEEDFRRRAALLGAEPEHPASS